MPGALEAIRALPEALRAKREAEELTNGQPGWVFNGYGDAARHAIAAGLIARRSSSDISKLYEWLNEYVRLVPPDDPRETPMDIANGNFGREVAPLFPSDEAFTAYILNWPDKKTPQSSKGTLQWFGR
jgi:hypothetical protein